MRGVLIHPVEGIGDITEGDDVAAAIAEALDRTGFALVDGDVLVITHKIVSKAEGMTVTITDERQYRELVENEAAEIIRRRGDLVIAQTRHGFICANAGVDRSNTVTGTAVLLPRDPDRSAHTIRSRIARHAGVDVPVVISDTFGRPWRRGLTDIAIGVSGIEPVVDLRGSEDMYGRMLDVTEVGVADELASAADLVMGKAAGIPAAVIRGADVVRGDGRAAAVVRPAGEDLFR